MGAFARWMYGREYIKLLLHWRWLVLLIAVPVSLVIELIEEQGPELDLLDEVMIDGILLPVTTWIILTFAARKMSAQFQREADLQRRQEFNQRLSEHREFDDLAHFLVRFPASLMPVEQAILQLYDQSSLRLRPVTQWRAASITPVERADFQLVLLHDNAQVGVLELWFPPDKVPTPAKKAELFSYAPDMAAALARAQADHRQAEQAYREARAYERRRLTQELHDSLAQQVFYLHLGLDQLAEDGTLGNHEAIQRRLVTMRDVAAEVYDQIRHNLSILRAWEQVNLTEAVTDLVRMRARDGAMSVEIDVQGEPGWLSPHTCEQVYSVVREALNNIAKHAHARHVQLELLWHADRLLIRLVDDGVGFDPRLQAAEGHYGLVLMRETVDALGGELLIESSKGQGTCLTLTVPLDLPDAEQGARQLPQRIHAALNALP